ncbi:38677_t:CDS:2, partial [Gigaspora margarita]
DTFSQFCWHINAVIVLGSKEVRSSSIIQLAQLNICSDTMLVASMARISQAIADKFENQLLLSLHHSRTLVNIQKNHQVDFQMIIQYYYLYYLLRAIQFLIHLIESNPMESNMQDKDLQT